MEKIMYLGKKISINAVAALMDPELREELHAQGIDSEQDFFNLYVERHREKFKEEFLVSEETGLITF